MLNQFTSTEKSAASQKCIFEKIYLSFYIAECANIADFANVAEIFHRHYPLRLKRLQMYINNLIVFIEKLNWISRFRQPNYIKMLTEIVAKKDQRTP